MSESPDAERRELARIYVNRGLTPELAAQVVDQLTAHDALAAHAREELGLHTATRARPIQAALASAAAFAVGATPPLAAAWLVDPARLPTMMGGTTLVLLAGLGAVAARLGGAPRVRGALRVAFWGAVAMGGTALLGRLIGTTI